MAAQTRIISQAEDGFTLLKSIVELVNNPEKITQAHQRIRDEIGLTQEVQNRFIEAKEFIEKHASLDADLKIRENNLAAEKQIHNTTVEKWQMESEKRNKELHDFANELNSRQLEHEKINQILASERNSLNKRIADIENERKIWKEDYEIKSQDLAKEKSINDDKSKKLAIWENKLKVKSMNLAALAQSDD